MWASRPSYHHDNDLPIDLSKKPQPEPDYRNRTQPEQRKPDPRPDERWLPASNPQPFVAEKYIGRCSVVSSGDEGKVSGRGTLETAIRKLHHNRQLKETEPSKERCRSTDIAIEGSEDISLDGKRSSSCPNLTVIKPKPSPIKPKSSFIQRSSRYLSENTSEPSNLSITSTNFQHDSDEHSNYQPKCGAKKRKSFIPVYGDRAPSPKRPLTPEEYYEKRRPLSLVRNEDYYHPRRPPSPYKDYSEKRSRSPVDEYSFHSDRRPPSPIEYYSRSENRARPPVDEYYSRSEKRSRSPVDEYYSRSEKRSRSPVDEYYSRTEKRSKSPVDEYYPDKIRTRSPLEHEEYFSHPEVLLRRQLQQHSPSPYLVHVYDYYQQLVQRMREHSSPGTRVPPPVSPPSGDDETQLDGQRKRPCRALTGKHVRQGTGASISTLLTLRQKIQERQKAKDSEPRTGIIGNSNRNGTPKKKSPKIKSKNPLQIQKC